MLFITLLVSATAAAVRYQLHTISDRILKVFTLKHAKISKCIQMLYQIWTDVSNFNTLAHSDLCMPQLLLLSWELEAVLALLIFAMIKSVKHQQGHAHAEGYTLCRFPDAVLHIPLKYDTKKIIKSSACRSKKDTFVWPWTFISLIKFLPSLISSGPTGYNGKYMLLICTRTPQQRPSFSLARCFSRHCAHTCGLTAWPITACILSTSSAV